MQQFGKQRAAVLPSHWECVHFSRGPSRKRHGSNGLAKLLSALDSNPEHASIHNKDVKFSIQTLRTRGELEMTDRFIRHLLNAYLADTVLRTRNTKIEC